METQYDVFLSHCGEDCKRDFAAMLKQELERAGIRCFLDERDLQLGDHATKEMLSAMERAHFGIAILSKGFFLREWCLKELQTFVKRKNLVPIFLGIGPGDLQNVLEEGPAVWEGFKKFPMLREEYGRVVGAAGAFTGQRLEALDGFWDTCIWQVKKLLLRLLGKVEGGLQLSEAGLLVGIDKHVTKLKQLSGVPVGLEEDASRVLPEGGAVGSGGNNGREIGIVGVKGMGGVGKTTLAKGLYDDPDVREFFGGKMCWVEVNQGPSEDRICKLQKQILWELCERKEEIGNPTTGRAKIRSCLSGAKVLVFLDNVWDEKGSNRVLLPQCLGPESRIVKTTRDEKLIGSSGDKYDLDVLDQEAACELFCWHAFSEREPPSRLQHFVWRATTCCGGLPLALELVGARVAEETRFLKYASLERWWEALLRRLERRQLGKMTVGRRESVLENLRLRFDALPNQGLKDAFLLLAGMWLDVEEFRETKAVVEKLAAALYGNARDPNQQAQQTLEELKCRSLLKVVETFEYDTSRKEGRVSRVTIHDLLSDMGSGIVNEKEGDTDQARKFCRWVGKDRLRWPESGTALWEHQIVSACKNPKMPALFFSSITKIKSFTLHYIHNPQLPKLSPGLDNCRLLSIQSCSGEVLGEDSLTGLENLHHLELTSCREITKPPSLSGLLNLHHLNLSNCRGLTVPPVLAGLKNLQFLYLNGCQRLRSPPVLKGLRNLQHLNLSFCSRLMAAPDLAGLKNLQHLAMSSCYGLTEPPAVAGLQNLQHLDLRKCMSLSEAPNVSDLQKLQYLDLRGCERLPAALPSCYQACPINA
jgi:hypothetical protein